MVKLEEFPGPTTEMRRDKVGVLRPDFPGIYTPVRLNLGAGSPELPGYVPIDRKLGKEVYPLDYPDETVEEVRASHILEHFAFDEVPAVLKEWVRVVKPGGRVRIAVPDLERCIEVAGNDPKWGKYIMGGQKDENDFHKSLYTDTLLRELMEEAGLSHIEGWQSEISDCASYPISLNLQGVKNGKAKTLKIGENRPQLSVKIAAMMSMPRFGSTDSLTTISSALFALRIPWWTYNGVFWGQCLQRMMEEGLAKGLDWIVTLDYDSLFTAEHLKTLMVTLGDHPEIDAIAAMQCRRGMHDPLMRIRDTTEIQMTEAPVKVDTAHFGLTIFRVEKLRKVRKPWLWSKPSADGTWGTDRQDDDIYFWNRWAEAGNTVYVAPTVRIGHLEVMVAEYDDEMKARHVYVPDWRKAHGSDERRFA